MLTYVAALPADEGYSAQTCNGKNHQSDPELHMTVIAGLK